MKMTGNGQMDGLDVVCWEGVVGQYKKSAFGRHGVGDEFRISLHLAKYRSNGNSYKFHVAYILRHEATEV